MDAKKKRAARTTILVLFVAATLVIAGAGTLLLRAPQTTERLRPYESPVMDAASGARLRVLLPHGWSVSEAHPDLNTAATSVRPIPHIYVTFRRARPMVAWWHLSSVMDRLRPAVVAAREREAPYAAIVVQVLPLPHTGKMPHPRGILHVGADQPPGCPLIYHAERTYLSPDGTRQPSVFYYRGDKAAFDETHARIANSLRFE